MQPSYAITFDIDWAPDWAIALCADICRSRAIPATFFATHASPLLDELGRDKLFEVGIHPNFLNGSSHGATFEAVMEHCLSLVPAARAMRTHDLFCSSSLLALIVQRYPQIRTDSSIFLPGVERCEPVIAYHGNPVGRIVRVPFSFADNVAARTPGWSWGAAPVLAGGSAVFDFHPSLVALNIGGTDSYPRLKAATTGRPLTATSRADFAPFVNAGPGARTYLERLIERVSPADCATLSAYADARYG